MLQLEMVWVAVAYSVESTMAYAVLKAEEVSLVHKDIGSVTADNIHGVDYILNAAVHTEALTTGTAVHYHRMSRAQNPLRCLGMVVHPADADTSQGGEDFGRAHTGLDRGIGYHNKGSFLACNFEVGEAGWIVASRSAECSSVMAWNGEACIASRPYRQERPKVLLGNQRSEAYQEGEAG